MQSYTNLPIASRLQKAQTAIQNAMDDTELLGLLTPFSYDAVKLGEGLALYDEAAALHHAAASERGEKLGATETVYESWGDARTRLRDHVALARIALRDDKAARAALRLDEARAATQASWIVQARQFYTRALEHAGTQAALAVYGIDEPALQDGLDRVNAFEASLRDRDKESGDAQDATHARNETMAMLDQWVRDFRDVAKVAFRDRPQLMERLGFMERGS